jgi:hypothetical protein
MTLPAIAGASGVLLAVSEGGTDNRIRPFDIGNADEADGVAVPGPGAGFGLGWPG